MKHQTTAPRRAFSIVEVLIALTISATLLTATLAALDTSFKAYQVTTESASTNVIARMVVHRIGTMVRNGEEFGPFPTDVLDPAQNPLLDQTFMDFRMGLTSAGNPRIIRVERRNAPTGSPAPFELWYVESELAGGTVNLIDQRPLLTGITDLSFNLEYDVGPRLIRATMDMTVLPNDFQDANFTSRLQTPTIRFATTMAPRRLETDMR
jgi:prepilin-type N-terminal cleavage/methylation domain-containing protein